MTPKGVVTVIHSFSNDALGHFPLAGLIQATDGKFYGGATVPTGVLFQATSGGAYSGLVKLTGTTGLYPGAIHKFRCSSTPTEPSTEIPSTGGSGTVHCGTAANCGVLYSLDMGLHPFVALMTTSGKAGKVIQILGNGLTGTTKVTFGSGSATFKVISDTYMTATVPAIGTSGPVVVTAPSGMRVSSKEFKETAHHVQLRPRQRLSGIASHYHGNWIDPDDRCHLRWNESSGLHGELRDAGDGNGTRRCNNRKNQDHYHRWSSHQSGNFHRNVTLGQGTYLADARGRLFCAF